MSTAAANISTAAGSASGAQISTARRKPIRLLVAAGGTGGHVYPGIAVADALREKHPDAEILFVGTRDRMEWKAVPRAGYPIRSIWISGFHRRLTVKNLLFPVRLAVSLMQSARLIREFRPDLVLCCGGFAAGPVGWVAARRGIPLFLQEQNSWPGVTTRLLASRATLIFTAFEEADRHLPEEKVMLAGNPVRKGFGGVERSEARARFGLQPEGEVLLILGGSGGSGSLNEIVERHLPVLAGEWRLQIIWQCGPRYFEGLSRRIRQGKYPTLRLVKFIDDMAAAYAAADLSVSRAGAITCSELMLTGTPSLLIPSPVVAGDHQRKNAMAMVEQGAAVLLSEEEAADRLGEAVHSLLREKEKLARMSEEARSLARPDAADRIVREMEIRMEKKE